MKKIPIFAVITIMIFAVLCSCTEKKEDDVQIASDISTESFKVDIIDRLSHGGKFDVWEAGNITSYTRDNLEYNISESDGYISSVSALVHNADTDFMKTITYYDIEKYDPTLSTEKKAGLDAVRYCAVALTCLCNLGDTDAIDTALDAINAPVTVGGWKISFDEQPQDMYVVFTVEYVGIG